MLPDDNRVAMSLEYGQALIKLYEMGTSAVLPENYQDVIQTFRDKFLVCWEAKIVNFTIKVHMLYSPIHLEKEMSDSQETVILGLCQGLEQLHSELNKTQKLHNTAVWHDIQGVYGV